jgi:hypothetical protein
VLAHQNLVATTRGIQPWIVMQAVDVRDGNRDNNDACLLDTCYLSHFMKRLASVRAPELNAGHRSSEWHIMGVAA